MVTYYKKIKLVDCMSHSVCVKGEWCEQSVVRACTRSPWLLTYCQTFVSKLSWIRCACSLSVFVDMGGNGC